ncbi:MAG: hypothetical protein HYY45_01635 [Deltaproteobacteria bacterium]|nr:hypothetical protein [Deltaproteobacteria bacterium]
MEWTKLLWGPVVLTEIMKALPEIPKALDHAFKQIDHALDRVPAWMERESETIEGVLTNIIVEGLRGLDIKQIGKAQLDKMDERELERMLTGNVTTELKFIQTSGGVFGLPAGLSLVDPASRPVLLVAALSLWLAYRVTVKKQTRIFPPIHPTARPLKSLVPPLGADVHPCLQTNPEIFLTFPLAWGSGRLN